MTGIPRLHIKVKMEFDEEFVANRYSIRLFMMGTVFAAENSMELLVGKIPRAG